jgi:hypothetical protein
VFVQISEALADAGIAVLRYNKRTCLAVSGIPGCTYPLCTGPNTPPNCVDFLKLNVSDYATDAANAVQFLIKNYAGIIDPSNVNLIGHSEGCTDTIYTALQAPVARVVQLAGIGIDIETVILGQLQSSVALYESAYFACKISNGNKQLMNAFQQAAGQTQTALEQAQVGFANYVNNPKIPDSQVINILATSTVGYWREWIAQGDPSTLAELTWQVAQNLNVDLLTINSPQDLQVWAQFYQPLQAMTMAVGGSAVVIEGLTHGLNPSDLSSNQVSEQLLSTVISFLQSSRK